MLRFNIRSFARSFGLAASVYTCSVYSNSDSDGKSQVLSTAQSNSLKPFHDYSNITVLGGTANPELTKRICEQLGIKSGDMNVTRFSDGEISIEINESIRGKDCFIIQTCAEPVNDNILELLLTITAARRSGAAKVTAVIPYFGYVHNRRGLPISTTYHSRFLWSASADFAKMLQTLGADKVISVDLQKAGQGQESCFFESSVPVETISTLDTFVEYISENMNLQSPIVVVSPNSEYIKKARKFETHLHSLRPDLQVDTCVLLDDVLDVKSEDTIKISSGDISLMTRESNFELLGHVRGADVIIVDDFVDTAARLSVLCRYLKRGGARRIIICASHGLFTENSLDLIDLSPVEKVLVTDSVPLPKKQISNKIVQITVAPLIAKLLESEVLTSQAIWDSEVALEESMSSEDDDEEIFELE